MTPRDPDRLFDSTPVVGFLTLDVSLREQVGNQGGAPGRVSFGADRDEFAALFGRLGTHLGALQQFCLAFRAQLRTNFFDDDRVDDR